MIDRRNRFLERRCASLHPAKAGFDLYGRPSAIGKREHSVDLVTIRIPVMVDFTTHRLNHHGKVMNHCGLK